MVSRFCPENFHCTAVDFRTSGRRAGPTSKLRQFEGQLGLIYKLHIQNQCNIWNIVSNYYVLGALQLSYNPQGLIWSFHTGTAVKKSGQVFENRDNI